MTTVSNNIKYLRRMNGLTQEQFARKIGIKRSLLGAYEEARANPNLENLMNIAKIFGTSVDHLLQNDIRRLRETRGVPLPQPAQQLLLNNDPEPPQQLSNLIDTYYQPQPEPEIRQTAQPPPQNRKYQPVKPVVAAPSPIAKPKPVESFSLNNPPPPVAPPVERTPAKLPIPLVNQKSVAEYLSSYAYADYLKQLPEIHLPTLPPGQKYRAFEGGVDFPQPGAIVVGQFIQNWYEIRDGQNYLLVVHKQGILYRRVYNQVKIRGTLLLSSDNPHFPMHEVSIKEVLEVWDAKAFISHQLPEPVAAVSFDRLSELVRAMQEEIEKLRK